MKKKWFDSVIRNEFLALVKDSKCPPTEEIRKHKGLYPAIRENYGTLDNFCKLLNIRRFFYNHIHFDYKNKHCVVRSKGEMIIYII